MLSLRAIYARGLDGEFGIDGQMPWERSSGGSLLHQDMAIFKRLTIGRTVIMGRRTFESLGRSPLAGRINIVITSEQWQETDVLRRATSLSGALALVSTDVLGRTLALLDNNNLSAPLPVVWVIGGVRLIMEAIKSPICTDVVRTVVMTTFPGCDVHMDLLEEAQLLSSHSFGLQQCSRVFNTSSSISYQVQHYHKRFSVPASVVDLTPVHEHPEYQYMNLVRDVIENGVHKMDRTNVGTRSLFGKMLRYDLSQNGENVMPLLTTKRVYFKGVVEELLWFLSGSTDTQELSDRGVKIWDDNTSRETLDRMGLVDYEVGELGPGYGHQWRRWGAPYRGREGVYEVGEGVDQIAKIVHQLKTEPHSRRIVLTAWNVSEIQRMALPPCHCFCQFYVTENKGLSCMVTMRSCDLGLGYPFNVASYALLTMMLAHVADLPVYELVMSLGDAHIYSNHVDALTEQLTRRPRALPKLRITRRVQSMDEFKVEDFELSGYNPHPKITMPMAV